MTTDDFFICSACAKSNELPPVNDQVIHCGFCGRARRFSANVRCVICLACSRGKKRCVVCGEKIDLNMETQNKL